jgi:hypothetical protein
VIEDQATHDQSPDRKRTDRDGADRERPCGSGQQRRRRRAAG